jgi:hypothetical protein
VQLIAMTSQECSLSLRSDHLRLRYSTGFDVTRSQILSKEYIRGRGIVPVILASLNPIANIFQHGFQVAPGHRSCDAAGKQPGIMWIFKGHRACSYLHAGESLVGHCEYLLVLLVIETELISSKYFGTMAGVRGFNDPNVQVNPDGNSVWHQ